MYSLSTGPQREGVVVEHRCDDVDGDGWFRGLLLGVVLNYQLKKYKENRCSTRDEPEIIWFENPQINLQQSQRRNFFRSIKVRLRSLHVSDLGYLITWALWLNAQDAKSSGISKEITSVQLGNFDCHRRVYLKVHFHWAQLNAKKNFSLIFVAP